MSGKRYPEEFKIEAVKQVVDRGHSVSSVTTRLDITTHSLYAWLQHPHSQRHQENRMLTGQIKQFWRESGCIYGYSKIHLDLRDSGQQCGVNRVWRLMKHRDKGSGRIPEPAGTRARGHAKPVSCRPTGSSYSSIRILRMSVG